MSYIVQADFKKQIQLENLNQIIGSDQSILNSSIQAAQSECTSYLIQKYNLTAEITDLLPWSPIVIYSAAQRVTVDYQSYDGNNIYAVNDCVTYQSSGYICTESTTGSFDPSKWVSLGQQFAIYHGTMPNPLFNVYNTYKVGDVVYWTGNTYTCQKATVNASHEGLLQVGFYQNAPLPNIFPDDPATGVIYWGQPTPYTIPAGTLPTNNKWTLGDNRDQQLVLYMIDIALYHVHSRISPRNIPDLRVKRYDDAVAWLKNAKNGEVTAAMPSKQPRQGGRIRYGGVVKNNNIY
ncbi:phage protein Gp36 family protein [Chitinophaga sp. Hz27]|uniref:phage protein Gp36 family protein n=1 Tax=Chitinophaga sp. Hz27 TaxID=3347169 RepID=UPI0035E0AE44